MRNTKKSTLTTFGKITIAIIISILLLTILVFTKLLPKQQDLSINNLTLKDTVSIFLLHNEKGSFFCIPIQYMFDYQIYSFEYTTGEIVLNDVNIPLTRSDINIKIYLNEEQDEIGSSIENFNLIYHEEKGEVIYTTIAETIDIKPDTENKQNHYYIFIERYLTDTEINNITRLYANGNTKGSYSICYDLTIDDEVHTGSGLQDNFELFEGETIDLSIIPNLNFFRDNYLKF